MTTYLPRHLALPGGVVLEHVERGRRSPERPSLLMLHGATDSWRSFEPVLDRLPPDQHAIALSQRGHGGSTQSALRHGTADHAADVLAAIDRLELDRPLLVGHSMGAHHALRVAVQAPTRLRGLVLIGAFAGFSDKPELRAWHDATIAPLADPVPPEVARAFQVDTLARAIDPDRLDLYVAESLRVPARIWRETFAGFFDDRWMGAIDGLALPTRLIWGERDTFVPREDQQRLQRWLRRSTLSVHAEAGHAVHWEDPARVATEIAAFAQAVGRERPTIAGD